METINALEVDVYKLIKGIKQELSASLRDYLCFIFRHFPQAIHPCSTGAQAAEAAAVQGQFWSMHDTLFIHQQS